MRNITIKPALNGYIVDVGCQTVVFASRIALMHELTRYLEKPSEVEAEYLKDAVNPRKRLECDVPCPTLAPVNDVPCERTSR